MWVRSSGERPEKSGQGRFLSIIGFALAVPLQSTLAPIAAIGGAIPDLPLVVVVLFALGHRRVTSVAAGSAVGAVVDLLSAGAGSFHLVAYAALALIASSVGRVTANVRLVTAVTVVAVCSVALGIAYAVTGPPVERADEMMRWLGRALAPEVAYNTAVGGCLFAIRSWWYPPSRHAVGERDELFSSGRFQGLIR
jgi:rod shape-determining protein MreD